MSSDIKIKYTDSDGITHIDNGYQTEYKSIIYLNDPADEKIYLSYKEDGLEYLEVFYPPVGSSEVPSYKLEPDREYYVKIEDLNGNELQPKTRIYEIGHTDDGHVYGISGNSKNSVRVRSYDRSIGYIDTSRLIHAIADGSSWVATEDCWGVCSGKSNTMGGYVSIDGKIVTKNNTVTQSMIPIREGQKVSTSNATVNVYGMM